MQHETNTKCFGLIMVDTELVPFWANLRRKVLHANTLEFCCIWVNTGTPCVLLCSDQFGGIKKCRDCAGLHVQNVWTALEPWCHVSQDLKPVSHHDELAARPKLRLCGCEADGKVAHNPNDKISSLRTESHTTATLNWQPSSPHSATLLTCVLLLILSFLSQNLAGDQAVDVEQHCGVL